MLLDMSPVDKPIRDLTDRDVHASVIGSMDRHVYKSIDSLISSRIWNSAGISIYNSVYNSVYSYITYF